MAVLDILPYLRPRSNLSLAEYTEKINVNNLLVGVGIGVGVKHCSSLFPVTEINDIQCVEENMLGYL